MGPASVTILLHEIIKLLHYAEVHDPVIIRTGTCGSLDTPLGTVIISDAAVNDFCEPYFCTVSVIRKDTECKNVFSLSVVI